MQAQLWNAVKALLYNEICRAGRPACFPLCSYLHTARTGSDFRSIPGRRRLRQCPKNQPLARIVSSMTVSFR